MAVILFHSSKSMHNKSISSQYQAPLLLDRAKVLSEYIQNLSENDLRSAMKVSAPLAHKTFLQMREWSVEPSLQSPAIDIFAGDMYSGLQAQSFTKQERDYANQHLYIISGLYGILRACDSIMPYRLEMGYKITPPYSNSLYDFWGDSLVKSLPEKGTVFNLSSHEYTKSIIPYLESERIVSPKFCTRNQKTNEPKQIVVHSKIARGAFVHWLIKNQISSKGDVRYFNALDYKYDPSLSTPSAPVYICDSFQGLGLSTR